jgi:hypothetical protein
MPKSEQVYIEQASDLETQLVGARAWKLTTTLQIAALGQLLQSARDMLAGIEAQEGALEMKLAIAKCPTLMPKGGVS